MQILIVDGKASVRSALRLLFLQDSEIIFVAEARNLEVALRLSSEHAFDLVLLDWGLPPGGEAALNALRELAPHRPIIVLSGRPEASAAALRAGADAFVSKGDPPEGLLSAVYRVTHRNPNPGQHKATPATSATSHNQLILV